MNNLCIEFLIFIVFHNWTSDLRDLSVFERSNPHKVAAQKSLVPEFSKFYSEMLSKETFQEAQSSTCQIHRKKCPVATLPNSQL